MNRREYLDQFQRALRRAGVSDAQEILSEYEQHFDFKLADGYTEEEICAKLGDPEELAVQFGADAASPEPRSRFLTGLALVGADLFAALFFLLNFAWMLVTAALPLCCAALAVCLLGDLNPFKLIPPMPYWCGAAFGLTLIALATLSAVGCVYCAAFVRQMMRAYGRFHRNVHNSSLGKPQLPTLSIRPHFERRFGRRLRNAGLVALAAFAVCFVLSMAAAMLSAGALEFWHAWGWFGYIAP